MGTFPSLECYEPPGHMCHGEWWDGSSAISYLVRNPDNQCKDASDPQKAF